MSKDGFTSSTTYDAIVTKLPKLGEDENQGIQRKVGKI